ncbi:MAG: glycosyltransferase family 1 protein [Bacilli bacterium]|nr:glycosyltransferase family 1 protein [Bacilli bacterium]
MKKILVITWFYPPVNSSEGLVTYKLLNNSRYEYDVFTQKNSASWSYGNNDNLENNKNINCIFAESNNLKDWKKEAIKYFKENKNKYDVVMTRSMPPESHEIGIKIKKIKPCIKWIASFGDPIANNPYVSLTKKNDHTRFLVRVKRFPKTLARNMLRKYVTENPIENKTIKYSDMIIFNSIEQQKYMLGNKKKESIVLAHSYYDKLYPKNVKKFDDKIHITYIGHLDKIRTPKLLLEAVRELKQADTNLFEKLEVDFYGNLCTDDKLYIFNNELYDVIKYKKQVGYLESLKIMKESNFLLHIDANLSLVNNENIFFAAKLADYIGSGTPIIGITMLDGASANILRDINGLVLTYSKSDIKNYLRKIIYENYSFDLNKDACLEYSAKKVAEKFDDMVSSRLGVK